MFSPLHVKSDYSLGYGTASLDELVERAAALGYRSLALTDLENLYGQVRFHYLCRQHGIRPITGVELRPGFDGRRFPGTRAGRLVLLAADETGYRNLCRIVSRRRGGVARETSACGDPVALARQHCQGLFALSDDPKVVERLLDGDAFQPEMVGLLLVRPAKGGAGAFTDGKVEASLRLGIRLVADLDAVFLEESDHPLHLLQLAVAQGRLLEEMKSGNEVESPDRSLRSPAEFAALFADLPEALQATAEIAACCRFNLGSEEGTAHLFNPEVGDEESRRLRTVCEKALEEMAHLEQTEKKRYRARLEEELGVFAGLHFSGFMLMVADILAHCCQLGIPVAVRGSAVSSLVLHLLGGSPVDPLQQGLLFERFLHPGKSAWPDVDIDLPWDRRDEVIDWVYQRFGADKAAMIAAHHTFRYRSALREGLKAWGAPDALIESMSRAIPADDLAVEEIDFLDLAVGYRPDPQRPDTRSKGAGAAGPPGRKAGSEITAGLEPILLLIRRLVGRPRHIAVHPGGIVIDWRPLDQVLPLELAPKGVVITQYDLVAVAKLGLVKIDLLGNRCLSEIEETLSLAGWQRPLRLASIPAEDPATLALIDRAQTIGCFQLESPAMRSLLLRLPIRRQSDLVAALALIRPGAAAGEVKNSFVRLARGEETADRVGETHGLLIYEEDIMLLLARTGGITLAQADEVRRGIVKSGGDAVALSSLQASFLESTQVRFPDDRHALARARRAWSVAVRFAAYSFNKAHAASYALLAYTSAYLKVHHPTEYACALLNHHQGLYPLRSEAAELSRMGITLLGPHVNDSSCRSRCREAGTSAGGKVVQVGLDKVRQLSRRAVFEIERERELHGVFSSLGDLLRRVKLAVHEVTALVLCGACDGLAPLDGAAYPFVHEAVVERLRQKCDPAELDGLRVVPPRSETPEEAERNKLYQALVRVRNELAYLEMHISAHPMALLRKEASRCGLVTIEEASRSPADSTVGIAAIVAAMRRVVTRQGPMQFISFEDETGVLEAVVFPAVYARLGERVTTPGPFAVVGRLKLRQGAVHLEVGRLEPFHERKRRETS